MIILPSIDKACEKKKKKGNAKHHPMQSKKTELPPEVRK